MIPRSIIAVALLLWACSAHAGEPKLVMHWSIANSGTGFANTGWNLDEGGWPGFINRHIRPAVEWCRASEVEPRILIHHPFSLYPKPGETSMAIDGLDQAKAHGAPKWLLNDFSTRDGWKSITKEVACYVYVGGVSDVHRLAKLPTAERAAMIARNLKPFKDAGFRGVFVDASENATSKAAKREVLTLAIADDMFPELTGLEAAPRALADLSGLWQRNVVAWDSTWRHRYGGFTAEQIKRFGYGERHSEYKHLGYDRSVLKGEAWRLLPYAAAEPTVELAKLIVAEGDVPGVCPQPLIQAGVKAGDIVGVNK